MPENNTETSLSPSSFVPQQLCLELLISNGEGGRGRTGEDDRDQLGEVTEDSIGLFDER